MVFCMYQIKKFWVTFKRHWTLFSHVVARPCYVESTRLILVLNFPAKNTKMPLQFLPFLITEKTQQLEFPYGRQGPSYRTIIRSFVPCGVTGSYAGAKMFVCGFYLLQLWLYRGWVLIWKWMFTLVQTILHVVVKHSHIDWLFMRKLMK